MNERPFPFALKYHWQIELEDYLSKPADDRTIVCIVDDVGGSGKTQWAKWYN